MSDFSKMLLNRRHYQAKYLRVLPVLVLCLITYFMTLFNSDCGRNVFYKPEAIRSHLSQQTEIQQIRDDVLENTLATISERDDEDYNVPKKIHFILIDSELPPQYVRNIQSYSAHNPDYQIFLWINSRNSQHVTKEMLESKGIGGITVGHINSLSLINKDLILSEVNSAAVADMLRYEILYLVGGVYVDIDSISLRPFDDRLSQSFTVYVRDSNVITNACLGFPKHSTFMLYVIRTLKHNFNNHDVIDYRIGKYLLTSCFLTFNDVRINVVDSSHLINPSYRHLAIPCYGPVYSHHFFDGSDRLN